MNVSHLALYIIIAFPFLNLLFQIPKESKANLENGPFFLKARELDVIHSKGVILAICPSVINYALAVKSSALCPQLLLYIEAA